MKSSFLSKNKFSWVYVLGLFLILTLPFLSFAPWFHPPGWSKAVVFKVVFSLLFFFFAYQFLFQGYRNNFSSLKKNIFNRKNRIFWPFWLVIALFGIYLLATIFSLDFHYSFWGSPYRGGGFINFGFYIIFAIFLFLITAEKSDTVVNKYWQKFWDFSFIIAMAVSLMAIFQKFGLFSKYIVPYTYRPVSSMGGPMFLALYLLLFIFLSLSFVINSRGKKKFFYLFSIFVFLFAILLSATRSVFLGIFVGVLFFIFFYPAKNLVQKTKKRLLWSKFLIGIVLIFSLLGVNWLQSNPQLVEKLEQGTILGPAFSRIWSFTGGFSIDKIIMSRGSGWRVAYRAVKDRPILGYGPENFSIGFDKHYDPNLPGIVKEPGGAGSTGWWDRAHNFILDIAVTAGIPALIIYLLLFITLFWQLQKIKGDTSNNYHKDGAVNDTNKKSNSDAIISHGIQATFIVYLTASFFNFDVFSTQFILFALIGYSLFLIYRNSGKILAIEETKGQEDINYGGKAYRDHKPWEYILIFVLGFLVIWFAWSANLKPLKINKDLNRATYYSTRNNQCGKAIELAEELLESHSIIDNYVLLSYIDILSVCAKQNPSKKIELGRRALQILEKSMDLRPYYTRIWLYFNSYASIIIEDDKELDVKTKEDLIYEAYYTVERAHELSPNRQEIYLSWIKTDMVAGHFEDAEKRADECIAINPEYPDCWWSKALIYINQGRVVEGTVFMETAKEKGLDIKDKSTLGQLIKVYVRLINQTEDLKYYKVIADIYNDLVELDYENFQYHASLAHVYKILGEYEKAREEALIVYELSPASMDNIKVFLNTLPPPYNQF